MNDYLTRLISRSFVPSGVIMPRSLSPFEKASAPIVFTPQEDLQSPANYKVIFSKGMTDISRLPDQHSSGKVRDESQVVDVPPAADLSLPVSGKKDSPSGTTPFSRTRVMERSEKIGGSPEVEEPKPKAEAVALTRNSEPSSQRTSVGQTPSASTPLRQQIASGQNVNEVKSRPKTDSPFIMESLAGAQMHGSEGVSRALVEDVPLKISVKEAQAEGGANEERDGMIRGPVKRDDRKSATAISVSPRIERAIQPGVNINPIGSPISSSHASPTIKVTIGRVEVRAVMERPSVVSKQTTGPALSLDEYLKQRREGLR